MRKVGSHGGQDIVEATLECGPHRVHILNFGCVVRRWLFDTGHDRRDIVLGFDAFDDYPRYSKSFGIIAGRVANRTCQGRFELNGKTWQLSLNNGRHHLHGGTQGLGCRVWDIEAGSDPCSIRLYYHSADGEEGYPASVDFSVTYRLDETGLHCDMRGIPDAPTPINLAQHNYYNLDIDNDIRQHLLMIDAEQYLPVDDELIPTGELARVANTRFDFRRATRIAQADPQARGHDHNLCLRTGRNPDEPAAQLISGDGVVCLRILSAEPGIQLYTASQLEVPVPGLDGRSYSKFGGICLEAQHYPDSLNQAHFPGIVCTPEQPYQQSLSMLVSAANA